MTYLFFFALGEINITESSSSSSSDEWTKDLLAWAQAPLWEKKEKKIGVGDKNCIRQASWEVGWKGWRPLPSEIITKYETSC